MTYNGLHLWEVALVAARIFWEIFVEFCVLIERGKRGLIMNMIVLYYPFYFLQFPLIPNSCSSTMTIIRLAQSHDSKNRQHAVVQIEALADPPPFEPIDR